MKNWLFVCVLCFVVQQYIASPTSSGNAQDQEAFEDVKELESLRSENNKPNNSEHHQQSEDTNQSTTLPDSNPEPEPQPNSRSAIFRHRGITQAKKSKFWNEKEQPTDPYGKYAGIQYSPADLAQYVFSTGDEEGVALAVEELVREGMMGRTDAINYLQDVNQMLSYMREYEQQKKLEEMKNRAFAKSQLSMRLPSLPREEQFMKREPKGPEMVPLAASAAATEHPHQEVIASTSEPKGHAHSSSTTARPKFQPAIIAEGMKLYGLKSQTTEKNIENYDFALQVIYKLSKDMFMQSIIKDDPVAEDTLSRLVTFMENEVDNKRVLPQVKQKVLAVISNALVDSLQEYQAMLPANKPPAFDDSAFSHQSAPSSTTMERPESYRKLSVGGM